MRSGRSWSRPSQTPQSTVALLQIEEAFRRVTARQPHDEGLRWFFRSWSMTNNSAMCVSGLGNRISMELRDQPLESGRLVDTLVSLHRIADEDLGVGNGLLHADLFYSMATTLCGDDAWQSKRYLTPEAAAFKQWKDRCALVDDDLVVGLLTTVVHEIYTHGEVEYLWPLFDGWLARAGMDHRAASADLAVGHGALRRHRARPLRARRRCVVVLRRRPPRGDGAEAMSPVPSPPTSITSRAR